MEAFKDTLLGALVAPLYLALFVGVLVVSGAVGLLVWGGFGLVATHSGVGAWGALVVVAGFFALVGVFAGD